MDGLDPDGAFERFGGRRVLELRPPGAITKRDAVGTLLAEIAPAACVVLGDDRGDAGVFQLLVEARAAGSTDGIAVAVRSQADPDGDAARAADVVLRSAVDTGRLLTGMARLVGRDPMPRAGQTPP